MIAITLVLPYLPFSSIFGFVPLPAPLMLGMIGLTLNTDRTPLPEGETPLQPLKD